MSNLMAASAFFAIAIRNCMSAEYSKVAFAWGRRSRVVYRPEGYTYLGRLHRAPQVKPLTFIPNIRMQERAPWKVDFLVKFQNSVF